MKEAGKEKKTVETRIIIQLQMVRKLVATLSSLVVNL